jgi:predicted transcriptional regulator
MRQNLTIAIEQDLIRRAKVLAAERGKSISRLLADELQRLVDDQASYLRAKESALAEIDAGLRLGGRIVSREELHER